MTSSLITGLTSSQTSVVPAARDPLQAQREARLRESKAAIETLRQQSSSAADQRKAAAKKKVEDLKARIQALKMSMPSDPKAAARMVAQLARELGAAVKAYGGSGGSMTDLASTSAATTPAADGTANAASAEASAQAQPAVDAVTSGGADGTHGEPGGEASETGKATPTDPYRKAIDSQQARAADQARKAEGVKADSEFITTVKGLMSYLKAMAKKAEADAKRSGDNGSDADTANTALDAVDSQVNEVARSLTGGMVSLMV